MNVDRNEKNRFIFRVMIEPETDFTFGEEIISKRLFDVIFHEKTRGYRFQLMYTLVIIHAL